MAFTLLKDLRILEVSAFVAAPLAGLTLAQLGAEVIRIDPPGGGIDSRRWPLADDGSSLYWHCLNRAKKSIFLDLKSDDGRSVFYQLLKTRSDNGGIVLTNLSGPEWLGFDALKQVREDVILVELTGHHTGRPAVDYTVNAAVGVPDATGPTDGTEPVNNMLPAWDGMAGLTLSTAILAALRARDKTGEAQHLRVALSDVAVGFLGNLGVLAETELNDSHRARQGNHVYGTFGHSLPTKDGRFVMVVAMTKRHWKALVGAAGLENEITNLEQQHSLDLFNEEDRYALREQLYSLFRNWSEQLTADEVASALDETGVLWGPYQSFTDLLNDEALILDNPMMHSINHSTIGAFHSPGSTIRICGVAEGEITAGPVLGADTQSILDELTRETS